MNKDIWGKQKAIYTHKEFIENPWNSLFYSLVWILFQFQETLFLSNNVDCNYLILINLLLSVLANYKND